MRGLIKKFYRMMGFLGVSLSLASCQFGFMSAESEQAPIKQSLSFSSDPSLVASRITLSINNLANFRLTLCEEVELLVSNANSQEVPVQIDTLFQLRSSNAQGRFYSDRACSNQITSRLVTKGTSRDLVYYKTSGFDYSTSPTNRDTLSVSYSTFRSQSVAANVVRVPTQLTFDTVPASLNVGVCSGAFTVTVRDGLGNAFSDNTKTVSLSSGSVGVFYSDSNCSASVDTVNLSPPSNFSSTIYFKATTVAASTSLTGSSGGLTSASKTITLTHTATQLTFDSPPSSLNVGACSGFFSVTARDGLGIAFSENTKTVTLSSGGLGLFYANATNCGSGSSPLTSVSLSSSSTSSTLYFKATSVVGSVTLTASSSGITQASSLVFLTHTATQLTFDSAPSSLNGGDCSNAFTVTSRDGLGNAFSENSKTIALDSASLGSFYSNVTDCTNGANPIMTVNVFSSSPSASLFFKTTNVGAGWIILNGSFSALSDASSTVTINHLVLDTSFNSSGQIVSSSLNGEYLAMAQYQLGYLVAGYVSVSGTARAYVARFDSSGTSLFQFTENMGASISSSTFNTVFVDGNDIYAAGYADLNGSSGKDLFIVKLNSSLTLNTLFNSQGSVTKDLSGNDSVIGITKNSAGELVAVDDKFEVAFFNKENGSFINAFQLTSPPSNAVAAKIAMDSTGNVVVAGTSNSKMAVMRFNPSSSSALVLSNPTEFQLGRANSVTIDTSNRILLAGQSGSQMAVVRLGAGALVKDNSFGTSGTLTDSASAMSEAKDIAIDSAGNLLIVGTASNQMAIRRYQSNGSMINPSINTKTLSFAQGAAVANDILLDGFKILLSGIAGSNPAIARLFP